jgi:hypothetical protein
MTVRELAELLVELPEDAEVKMQSGASCSVVRNVDYEWDGEQSSVLLTDYPGTIRSYTGPKYCDENTDSGHSSSSGLNDQ